MLADPSNSIRPSSLTSFLAVWGAILSSITFGWTLYRDVRDRAKIRLSAQVRRIGQRQEDGAYFSIAPEVDIAGVSQQLFVVVSVVNIGRRRMRWKGVGGYYRRPVNGKNGFVISARFLPKTLEEQEAHDEFTELDVQFTSGNVTRIFVTDVADRKWLVSRREMKNLVADAKKYS